MPHQLERLREHLAGRYNIERELGRGGMATVYLAHDTQHDRPVALKVLHPELAASLGSERFQREIKLAARLQHPHILGVYDSGVADGFLWFTMPYVDGESLRDRLTRERQLPIADAVRITREVALALDFAHRHDVVHRDIKPENILLIDGQAMLADFGIARALHAGEEENLTGTGMSIGTPSYMSPEQAAGEKSFDARTDIYSLACVLYELLAGEPPFSGPTVQAVIVRVMTETARPLDVVRPAVSRQLAGAIAQAMSKTPADRPATAGDFARLLETSSTIPATIAINSPAPVTTAPAHSRRGMWIAAAALFLLVGVTGAYWMTKRGGLASGEHRVAVLPFENAGSAEDAYFADGMTDEVRSRLSAIRGLRVTARASSSQYRRSTKTPREIGRELGVQFLLTGTVRWSKTNGVSRVRVTPELTDVSSSETRWSLPYDTVMSDVFQVQASIAAKVAEALNVALAPPVREQIAKPSTSNLDAYDEFLKGEQLTNSMSVTDAVILKKALVNYERAVQLDSTFVKAWSAVARAYSIINGEGPTKEGVEKARVATERAVQLAPDRLETRLAMGVYLLAVKTDYAGAREQYMAGLASDPNNADLLSNLATVETTLGRFDDALKHAKQATELDPRSISGARRLAMYYHYERRFPEALAAWNRALVLAPQALPLIQGKAFEYLSQGQLDSVHAMVHSALAAGVDTTSLLVRFALYQETMWTLPPELWPKIVTLTVQDFGGDRGHWGLKIGHTYKLLGDTARARMFGDSARAAFEKQARDFPARAQVHELMARALALGGHKTEAVTEAERSLALRETVQDASLKPYVHFQVARILIQSGEYERALDLLEPLLTTPASDVTPAYLRIDPTFKPLLGNPRFEKMIR